MGEQAKAVGVVNQSRKESGIESLVGATLNFIVFYAITLILWWPDILLATWVQALYFGVSVILRYFTRRYFESKRK